MNIKAVPIMNPSETAVYIEVSVDGIPCGRVMAAGSTKESQKKNVKDFFEGKLSLKDLAHMWGG